jgi:hypothetical protein
MAFRDFDYDREYGIVPDLVKQFVVYLYRHIRSVQLAAACSSSNQGLAAVQMLPGVVNKGSAAQQQP